MVSDRMKDAKLTMAYSGRQLDFAPSPIAILPAVVSSLTSRGLLAPRPGRGKFEIFVDGGVRRATDVLKAVALGATAVGIGRPMIYAMSTYGEDGVSKLLQILKVGLSLIFFEDSSGFRYTITPWLNSNPRD